MKYRMKTGAVAVTACWGAAAFLIAAAQIVSLCFSLNKNERRKRHE